MAWVPDCVRQGWSVHNSVTVRPRSPEQRWMLVYLTPDTADSSYRVHNNNTYVEHLAFELARAVVATGIRGKRQEGRSS